MLAMIFGLATWAWGHGESDFSEPGTAMLLTAAVLATQRSWRAPTARHAALAGLVVGCVGLTRTTTFLFVPVFLIAGLTSAAKGERLRQMVAFGLGVAPAVVAFSRECMDPIRKSVRPGLRGCQIQRRRFTKESSDCFSVPARALSSTHRFLSSYFSQPVPRTSPIGVTSLPVASLLAVHVYIFARFEVWSGENAYGPRYMVPLLPIMIAVLAPVISRQRQFVRGAKVAAAVGLLGARASRCHYRLSRPRTGTTFPR